MSEYIAALVMTRLHPWLTDITHSLQRIERDLDTVKRGQKTLRLRPDPAKEVNQAGIRLGHVYEPQADPAAALGSRMNEMVQKMTEQHIAEQTGLKFGEAGGRYRCESCAGRGWKHDDRSVKHNRDPNERCKKCNHCVECQGAGVLFDKAPCKTCSTRGFLHVSPIPHGFNPNERCETCDMCPACGGQGVVGVVPTRV
ncbi:hypothetical protein HK097_001413 [Rhizophlyctis rosea]|uniref:Uncharacterized protein n=1 Tax=Rhizophlyctis rosea TaxID=64517 RepID=A0AAD5S5P9_9FUNG|nr:hypothetical protein HK097_001413 [Rhizophlyctis rosea]